MEVEAKDRGGPSCPARKKDLTVFVGEPRVSFRRMTLIFSIEGKFFGGFFSLRKMMFVMRTEG